MGDFRKIKGKKYKRLIEILFKHSNRIAFVADYTYISRDIIEQFFEPIRSYLIEIKEPNPTSIYYFHLNYFTKEFILEKSDSLYDWDFRNYYPENLMFFKDEKMVFSIITHEEEITYISEEVQNILIKENLISKLF